MQRLSFALALMSLAAAGQAADNQSGEENTVRFSKRMLFAAPYENCAVADLNRDGKLDIVYEDYWLEGPSFVPHAFRPNHTSSDFIRTNSVFVYDLDGDGWPDIITGGWNEDGIYWYKNPGNSAKEKGAPWDLYAPWEAHLLAKTRGRMEMFALHDFDGDGLPELYSACYVKTEPLEIWRFKKSAAGAFTLEPFILGVEGGGHGFAFGDVNGDGREDVLCEVGWYERPAGDPFAHPWKFHKETALPHPSCPFVVRDLNGDGRLDIIFGRGHDYGLFWWEQSAPSADGTTTWKKHTIDESWSQAHCLAMADLDGDGQDELIAGKCVWAHNTGDPGVNEPPAVYYYSWDKASSKFTRHTIAAEGEGISLGRQFVVTDLNGDGRPDIVAPSKLGLWLLTNEGIQKAVEATK
jgi:hypothetical protein